MELLHFGRHRVRSLFDGLPSKTPVVRRIDESSCVAAGLSGMGIAIGMETGKSAAALLTRLIHEKR